MEDWDADERRRSATTPPVRPVMVLLVFLLLAAHALVVGWSLHRPHDRPHNPFATPDSTDAPTGTGNSAPAEPGSGRRPAPAVPAGMGAGTGRPSAVAPNRTDAPAAAGLTAEIDQDGAPRTVRSGPVSMTGRSWGADLGRRPSDGS